MFGLFRRSKFVSFDTLRNHASKLIHKKPIQESIQRTTHHYTNLKPSYFYSKNRNAFEFSLPFRYGLKKQYQCSPFFNGAKQYYCVQRNQVSHIQPRKYKIWFLIGRRVAVWCGVFVIVGVYHMIEYYVVNLETIPGTKRTHFMPVHKSLAIELGETEFSKKKALYEGKILPAMHPESERVNMIAEDIIEALKRGLKNERVGSRKKGGHVSSSHLEGLNWEVLVVDNPDVNAMSLPGGKIIVFSGILEKCKTDSEIAVIIGHEVGHIVARHSSEIIVWRLILSKLPKFVWSHMVTTIYHSLHRTEMEADHIGVLLMASAGYDPRIAPKVYEKIGESDLEEEIEEELYKYHTHPPMKKRVQELSKGKGMQKALIIYRDVKEGHDVKGFLCD